MRTAACSSRSIRDTFARPKWTRCRATPAKRGGSSVGRPSVGFQKLVEMMVEADLESARAEAS